MRELQRLAVGVFTVSAALVLLVPMVARGEDEEQKAAVTGRYQILNTALVKTMQKELSAAVASGYRVISGDAGNNILLLEKDSTGKTHEYVYADRLVPMLEDGRVKGYRILPATFGAGKNYLGAVLEKLQEGESQSEYHVVDTIQTGNFEKDLNEWGGKGYRLVALSGSLRNYGLMERTAGAPASGPTELYVLLATSRTGTMEKELAEAVARGYRVVGASGAHKEMLVALEKLAPGDPKRQYRLLATARSGTLEREIVTASHEGYRVLPMTLSALQKSGGLLGTYGYEVAVLTEKDPGAAKVEYKILATKRVSTLEKELADAASSGWTVNRLYLSFEEQIILLEKARQ